MAYVGEGWAVCQKTRKAVLPDTVSSSRMDAMRKWLAIVDPLVKWATISIPGVERHFKNYADQYAVVIDRVLVVGFGKGMEDDKGDS